MQALKFRSWFMGMCVVMGVVGGGMVGLVGCQTASNISDQSLTSVDLPTLKTWVAQADKKHVVVVDVRLAEVYDAGHIPGAINLTLPNIRANDPALTAAKTIVVYGSTWTDSLTPASVKRLLVLGYTNVVGFRGGWDEWSGNARKP